VLSVGPQMLGGPPMSFEPRVAAERGKGLHAVRTCRLPLLREQRLRA